MMTSTDIRHRFARVYNGQPNFMTPTPLLYGKRGRHLWELSVGEGMDRENIYGVTVIDVDDNKCRELSRAFTSRAEALAYIRRDFTAA